MEDLWHLTGYLPSKCHPVVAVCVWSGYVQLSIVQKRRLQEMLHIFSLQHKPHLFICCQRMISVSIHPNYTHNANKEWVKLQKKLTHTHTHLLHFSPLIVMKYCKHTPRFFSIFLLFVFLGSITQTGASKHECTVFHSTWTLLIKESLLASILSRQCSFRIQKHDVYINWWTAFGVWRVKFPIKIVWGSSDRVVWELQSTGTLTTAI